MKPMLFGSAAVLFAAMTAMPSLAAVDTAVIVKGTSSAAPAASTIDDLVGKWTMQDLNALSGAKTVTVFDTKIVYGGNDLAMLSDADTRAIGDLQKLHQAIDANATLKAWFAKNKIDVNRVITVTTNNGAVDLYLY